MADPTKYIELKMSKDEQAAFNILTDEEKEIFKKEMLAKKQKTTFTSVVLAQLMLENMDDMESFNLYQGKLKVTTRTYKTQMNAFMNKVFMPGKVAGEDIDILTKISSAVEKLIDDHYDTIKNV